MDTVSGEQQRLGHTTNQAQVLGLPSPAPETVTTLTISPATTPKKGKKCERESRDHVEVDTPSDVDETSRHSAGDGKEGSVPYLTLFRFAIPKELVLLGVGCLCAVLHGALVPGFSILLGRMINSFGPGSDPETIFNEVKQNAYILFGIGAVAFITSLIQVSFLLVAAQRQGRRIRLLYLQSLLRQEMGWYDSHNAGELASRVSGDVVKVEGGIGDKVGNLLQYLAMFCSGFGIGFYYSWKLSLVILSAAPVIVFIGWYMGKNLADMASLGQTAYAKAGGIAEEALSMIRTVVSFGGEDREKTRYLSALDGAYKAGVRQGHNAALGMGATLSSLILVYALGFWYGNRLVNSGEIEAGDVLTVFFSIMTGAMSLGSAAPSFQAFSVARGAAFKLFAIIDQRPTIDSLSEGGQILDEVKGDIILDNIGFAYPSRPNENILKGFSLTLKRGETVALVGHSGCGKSTTVQLLERFYDPSNGDIRLDGVPLKNLNVQWLRSQIGLVSQMPTLFDMTIAENIALGSGVRLNENYNASQPPSTTNRRFLPHTVTKEQIEAAAVMADAHDFISRLPKGYDTMVGDRGAQLSGGQKQRIAIARALVKNPRILLLDEATSALDTASEREVQKAIEGATQGRTTIVVAHRLSTIKNADRIAVIQNGRVVEIGSHQELLHIQDGHYCRFVELQNLHHEGDKSPDDSQSADENTGPRMTLTDVVKERKTSLSALKKKISGSIHHPGALEPPENENDANQDQSEKAIDNRVLRRAFKMNAPEWLWILVGSIFSIGSGAVWPLFSVIFADITAVMLENDSEQVRKYTLIFVALAISTFVCMYVGGVTTAVAGERLTLRLRAASFESILHQPISFFDHPENSVGILCGRLATEASQVQAVTGNALSNLITQASIMVLALILALAACWQLTLVVMVTIPVLAFGSILQMRQMSGFAGDVDKVYAAANRVAAEAVNNIRTVSSLGVAPLFLDRYNHELWRPAMSGLKKAFVAGLGFGFTEFMMFAIWGISFLYGAHLMKDGTYEFAQIMKGISSILISGMVLGNVAVYMPDTVQAKIAATKIFRLLDLRSSVDSRNLDGYEGEPSQGHVQFSDISFEYPNRPEVPVLRQLSVEVKPGRTLALVGESGCGKSTLMGLLERFYTPSTGTISVDDRPITSCQIRWLRSQIGLVSQEPDLFDTTVRENILYGLPPHQLSVVTDDVVIQAAKLANAHEFISALPQGYDTPVGERGSKLSGGQKQRIAIARALVKNPPILLLDEATSALDAENERIVQEALRNVQRGRTTIVIAHRLSTIQDADTIAVIQAGRVGELGTHAQLLDGRGLYAALVAAQDCSQ